MHPPGPRRHRLRHGEYVLNVPEVGAGLHYANGGMSTIGLDMSIAVDEAEQVREVWRNRADPQTFSRTTSSVREVLVLPHVIEPEIVKDLLELDDPDSASTRDKASSTAIVW